jgi:hypothetical protein
MVCRVEGVFMTRMFTAFAVAVAVSTVALSAEQPATKKTSQPAASATAGLNGKMAITGNPSTLVGCAGGTWYNTHALGASIRGTRIRIDVEGDDTFDGVATAVIVQMGAAAPNAQTRVSYQTNDDSDGLDPRLEFTLDYDANLVLSVASFDGSFGCYFVKVDVRLP